MRLRVSSENLCLGTERAALQMNFFPGGRSVTCGRAPGIRASSALERFHLANHAEKQVPHTVISKTALFSILGYSFPWAWGIFHSAPGLQKERFLTQTEECVFSGFPILLQYPVPTLPCSSRSIYKVLIGI